MHYNLLNEVMSGKMSVTPTPGMMGTMFVGSDRYMVVCLKVLSPKRVLVGMHADFKTKNVDGIDYYDGSNYGDTIEDYLNAIVPNKEHVAERYEVEGNELDELYGHLLNDFNRRHTFSLRQNGRWLEKGASAWSTGAIHWGAADEYRDPSF